MRPRIFAVLAVSAFALVGCGASEPSAQPTATVTATANSTAPEEPSAAPSEEASTAETEEAYLIEYKQVGGITGLYDEEELIEFGYDACEIVEHGGSVPLNKIGETGDDHSVAITTEMAAKVTLCPEVAN